MTPSMYSEVRESGRGRNEKAENRKVGEREGSNSQVGYEVAVEAAYGPGTP